MRKFVERPGKQLTRTDIRSIMGKCEDFDDICAALKYYKDKGEHVYFLFNGTCMNSDDVDKYVNIDYVYGNCPAYIKVGPITSIDDFAREVECIGDWRDPKNQASYVKIMLQLVGMYHGYRTDLTLDDGIKGPIPIISAFNSLKNKISSANDSVD